MNARTGAVGMLLKLTQLSSLPYTRSGPPVLVMRGAEQRSWASAFSYGLVCALVGLVLFGWLLRVDLPEGPIERQFFTLVR